MHPGRRSFLRSPIGGISLNRHLTEFTLWLIAITLLLSRPTFACQQITPGMRASSEYTGIEIIPRGGAWKAPARARNRTEAKPSSSPPLASVQPETVRPVLANRPQARSIPYEDPKPFHRNSQFAETSVSPPTEIKIKSPNFAQRNAEDEALQVPAEYPVTPAVTENRNAGPTVVENAVPLIHTIEPPPYIRPVTETATASVSVTPQTIELWKPLRRFERAERLIDQKPTLPPSYAANEKHVAEKQTDMIESFDALDIETIAPRVLESESSEEPRVVAPEPRKPRVRKSAVAANSTNYPRAGHSLLAAPSRPPLTSRGPITFPQDPPMVAGNPPNSAPRQNPLTIPKQAQPTTQPLPAAVASGRYGRYPSTAHTTAGRIEGPLPASRYGATVATNANYSIPTSAAKANTRYAPATSQHQSVPARQAGHSMLQPGTSYRQTR